MECFVKHFAKFESKTYKLWVKILLNKTRHHALHPAALHDRFSAIFSTLNATKIHPHIHPNTEKHAEDIPKAHLPFILADILSDPHS